MLNHQKEKWVALSSFCKENELSIDKDFSIENQLLPKLMKDDFKVSGYKFRESVLKQVVPDFGFNRVVKRPTKPKELYVFVPDENDNLFIFLWTNNVDKDRRAIEESIESQGLIEKPIDDRSVNVNQCLRILSSVVYSNDIDSEVQKKLIDNCHKKIDVFASSDNELINLVYNSL